MKRMMAAVTVPDNASDSQVSEVIWVVLGEEFPDLDYGDVSVWEWPNFWLDVQTGQVGPNGDKTQIAEAADQVRFDVRQDRLR